MSDPTRPDASGPGPAFLADGSYDLSTPATRLAACEAALANIAIVPQAYGQRGAEFCRDEMQRQASELLRQLRSVVLLAEAGDREVYIVIGTQDVSDFDTWTEDYCVRACSSRAAADEHARRASDLAAQAQAYEPPPVPPHGPPRTVEEYLALVHAAVPGLRDADPQWQRGSRASTRYRVNSMTLDIASRPPEGMTARLQAHTGSAPVSAPTVVRIRVIDALQRADVLDGSKWMALPLPSVAGQQPPPDFTLPQQTIGVDPGRKRMYWCDGIYDARAIRPSRLGAEAALSLPKLLGECTLVDASRSPEPDGPRSPTLATHPSRGSGI